MLPGSCSCRGTKQTLHYAARPGVLHVKRHARHASDLKRIRSNRPPFSDTLSLFFHPFHLIIVPCFFHRPPPPDPRRSLLCFFLVIGWFHHDLTFTCHLHTAHFTLSTPTTLSLRAASSLASQTHNTRFKLRQTTSKVSILVTSGRQAVSKHKSSIKSSLSIFQTTNSCTPNQHVRVSGLRLGGRSSRQPSCSWLHLGG